MILENARWKRHIGPDFWGIYGEVDGKGRWISVPQSYEILGDHIQVVTVSGSHYIIEDVANNKEFMTELDEAILKNSYST